MKKYTNSSFRLILGRNPGFGFIVLMVMAASVGAAPDTIRFQGRLTDAQGKPVAGPDVKVRFVLYNAPTNGSMLWQGPLDQSVATNEAGLFSTDLGPVPTNVVTENNDLYLQVSVNDGVGFKTLSPRQKLSSVPYAMRSEYAAKAATATFIAENAVSNLSIQTGAVESRHFKPGAVDTGALANGAVVSEKILDGEVKNSDIEVSTITRDRLNAASFEAAGAGLVPQDAILMFLTRTTCPAGYSEVTALRSKIPIGVDLAGSVTEVPDTVGSETGSLSHTHSIVHAHKTAIQQGLTQEDTLGVYGNQGDKRFNRPKLITQFGVSGGALYAKLLGVDHFHETNFQDVSASGAANSLPPSVTVIFCSKN